MLELICALARLSGAFYIIISDEQLSSPTNPYYLALVHRGVNYLCAAALLSSAFIVSRAAKIALRPALSQLGGYRQL
jgi:hypothetical protein